MPTLAEDLAFRGLIHQMSDPELTTRLERPITLYVGFDPSADSLHIGNLLQLATLRRFQLAGHAPIVVAGGGTGMIGDPGGKSEERNLLTADQIDANLAGISPQLERFLDFSEAAGTAQARLVNNADWLGPLSTLEFLRDVGKHFTVNQMIQRDSVRNRIERPEQGISYTEFSYMLLQAYDFLHLFGTYGCELQLGASDQWGNIVSGIDLIRRVTGEKSYALTSPLVLKADGTKFGKSESGALFLDPKKTSPYELYQFFVRSEDSVVGTYLRYFTFYSHAELLALDDALINHPERRESQTALARAVVDLVHGESETARVVGASEALFSEAVVSLDEATLLMVTQGGPSWNPSRGELEENGGYDLATALAVSGLVTSLSQARKTIAQGGAYINNRRAEGDAPKISKADLIADRYVVLRRGRREISLLVFE